MCMCICISGIVWQITRRIEVLKDAVSRQSTTDAGSLFHALYIFFNISRKRGDIDEYFPISPEEKNHTVSSQVIVVAISAELKQRITAALENITKDMLQHV